MVTMLVNHYALNLVRVSTGRKFLDQFSFILILEGMEMIHFRCGRMQRDRFITCQRKEIFCCFHLNEMHMKFRGKLTLTSIFRQMLVEVQSWPYSFPASEDFLKSDRRGSVSGRLLVRDRYQPFLFFFSTGM